MSLSERFSIMRATSTFLQSWSNDANSMNDANSRSQASSGYISCSSCLGYARPRYSGSYVMRCSGRPKFPSFLAQSAAGQEVADIKSLKYRLRHHYPRTVLAGPLYLPLFDLRSLSISECCCQQLTSLFRWAVFGCGRSRPTVPVNRGGMLDHIGCLGPTIEGAGL